jgi:hypothetical protein
LHVRILEASPSGEWGLAGRRNALAPGRIGSALDPRGNWFLEFGQLGSGAPLDEERNEIPYRALLKFCIDALNGDGDLCGRDVRILGGQRHWTSAR